jgi:chorismate mutase
MGTPMVLNRPVYFRAASGAAARKLKPMVRKNTTAHPSFFSATRFKPTKNIMKTTSLILAVMSLFVLNTKADSQEQLAACRQQIDSLDQRIVDLIQQRARVVKEVGNIKREARLPVTVPSREQQVVEKAQALAQAGPLPPEAVGRIYQKLVEEMRNWETKLDAATP